MDDGSGDLLMEQTRAEGDEDDEAVLMSDDVEISEGSSRCDCPTTVIGADVSFIVRW